MGNKYMAMLSKAQTISNQNGSTWLIASLDVKNVSDFNSKNNKQRSMEAKHVNFIEPKRKILDNTQNTKVIDGKTMVEKGLLEVYDALQPPIVHKEACDSQVKDMQVAMAGQMTPNTYFERSKKIFMETGLIEKQKGDSDDDMQPM